MHYRSRDTPIQQRLLEQSFHDRIDSARMNDNENALNVDLICFQEVVELVVSKSLTDLFFPLERYILSPPRRYQWCLQIQGLTLYYIGRFDLDLLVAPLLLQPRKQQPTM